jgi:hypothetical protein
VVRNRALVRVNRAMIEEGTTESEILQDLVNQLRRFEAEHRFATVIMGEDVQAAMPENPAIDRCDFFVHARTAKDLDPSRFEVANCLGVVRSE